ncbi:hypothetical protein [Kineococcus sp. R86509]|uniref:hypothetical protein n=1 Tax=Kineococcus sp. R86509 TaxID=3093851 RepID=UPI0036D4095A
MTKDEYRRRWAGTARTATAGALIGAIGGAVAGTSSLLSDDGFSTGAALFFGGGFGAAFGALFGVGTGAVGGCLAVHVVRRHVLLARTLLAVCSGVLIALATAWSLGPEMGRLGWIVLAGVVASTAAWLCAPWCLRPLRAADLPA